MCSLSTASSAIFASVTASAPRAVVSTAPAPSLAAVTASAAIFAVVTCKSPRCAVSILPSTKCSESTASSAILAPVIASAAISAVSTLTVNVKSTGPPSVPLSVSVQLISIPPPSTNLTSLAV